MEETPKIWQGKKIEIVFVAFFERLCPSLFSNSNSFCWKITTQKWNKISCCIGSWFRQTNLGLAWFPIDSKWGIYKDKENLWNRLSIFLTDFNFRQQKIFLTTRTVRLSSGHYATKYHYFPSGLSIRIVHISKQKWK